VVAVLVLQSLLMHAVFVAQPRYALPVLPLLIVAGVAAAAPLARGVRAAARRPAGQPRTVAS
jgi:hypothetical protein